MNFISVCKYIYHMNQNSFRSLFEYNNLKNRMLLTYEMKDKHN